jgi:hypothetical protein
LRIEFEDFFVFGSEYKGFFSRKVHAIMPSFEKNYTGRGEAMPSVIIGKDIQTGQEVRLGDIERRSGLYILGKPGMGKSALMVNMINQDIQNGHGVFFLDPHGQAIDDLLNRGGKEFPPYEFLYDSNHNLKYLGYE